MTNDATFDIFFDRIFSSLKDNDGSNSGLDADKLDGQEGSFYLPTGTYTASDIISKLKTVDGSGSGLDADLLDGQEGDYYYDSPEEVFTKLKTHDPAGAEVNSYSYVWNEDVVIEANRCLSIALPAGKEIEIPNGYSLTIENGSDLVVFTV